MATYTNAQYEAAFAKFKGTYKANASQPKLAAYNGDTAVEMFEGLMKAGYSTAVAGETVLEEWIRLGFVSETQAIVGQTSNFVNDSGNSADNLLPGWAEGLATFLGDVTSQNLWIRVAKIVIGGALIIVGVSKMTGASNAVTHIAEKVPVVPL